MKYLLDTNVLSALRGAVHGRESKDPTRAAQVRRIRERTQSIPASDVAMSMVSLGELRVWVEKHQDRSKAENLTKQLLAQVACVGLAPSDTTGAELATTYGQTRAQLEAAGTSIGGNDLWIAAHAKTLGLTVVTNNTSEFKRVSGLAVEDWTE